MDTFSQSCSSALEYPHNIVPSRYYPHVLDLYAKLLRTLGPRLFCEEDKARVELWQSHEDSQFHHETVQTHSQLKSHLCTPFPSGHRHPQSRFFIIQTHRNSSREKLNVTNEMMTHILSYHQVMPQFTEVLASFGKDAAQDFQFCGFKSELWTALSDRALAIPELNRSGRTLELCYSLRAVEPSNSYKGWPWSVKQLGISHSFDVEKGQSAWIVLKADGLMKDRIMSATRSTALPDMRSFGDRSQSFTSSLSTHLLFCEWSVEHWRWYINFMETQIQEITGARVFVPVIVQPGKKAVQELLPAVHQTRARTLTFGRIRRSNTWASISRSLGLSQNSQNVRTGRTQGLNNDRSCGAANATPDGKEDEDSSFSYDDLQRIQVIEEKVNEAILVLTTNNQILNQLRGLYSDLDKREGWPLDLSQKSSVALCRFENRVGHLQCELDLLQKRTETLMALLSSRKTLVSLPIPLAALQDQEYDANNFSRFTEYLSGVAWKRAK